MYDMYCLHPPFRPISRAFSLIGRGAKVSGRARERESARDERGERGEVLTHTYLHTFVVVGYVDEWDFGIDWGMQAGRRLGRRVGIKRNAYIHTECMSHTLAEQLGTLHFLHEFRYRTDSYY